MKFKFDAHVHTSEVSPCGQLSASDTVLLYSEAGYSGVCITDHFTDYYFEKTSKSWKDKVDDYLKGYRAAVNTAKTLVDGEFTVLLGMEIQFKHRKGNNNEYLVYGFDEDFLYENPELYKIDIERFSEIAQKNNLLIFQAHPFRDGMVPSPPAFLFGIEAFNANPRHNSRNAAAKEYAEKNNLRMISGSDCHQSVDVGLSGIVTETPIRSMTDFISILRDNNYHLITF
ncbi:MAG: PHP domain-containing protein [Tepidanaerobacteraceae bacterium]|nr:PHP domain-containing protein [Tepidanaerobacteraceae bacterium]